MPQLDGQTAIVTGGNSGIGEAIARGLSNAGAHVVINYVVDEAAANQLVEELRAKGSSAEAMYGDVSVEEDVAKLFRHTEERFGTVDILVNNAGLQRDAPIHEMTLEQWEKVIDVNLTGPFLCAREAIRAFRRRGPCPERSQATGKILFISSVHEQIPWAGHVNYAASKGGVLMLMKSLALEVAHERIRVNGIAPGAVRTSINRSAWEDPEKARQTENLIPYNRIGNPDDIAEAAVWLVSEAADYVNGASLYVDGGMTLYPGFATGG